MDRYSSYIQKLKQTAPKADFASLYAGVEERVGRKKRAPFSRPLIAVSVAAMLFILLLPFWSGRFGSAASTSRMTAYIFQDEMMSDHLVAGYVLGD